MSNAPDGPSAGGSLADSPQPVYRAMREAGAAMLVDEMVVVCGRSEIETILRDPLLFSSNMAAVEMGNVRPMIPLQIDPPGQKKYRKVLDPLFAPRRMAPLEEPMTSLVDDLVDRFEARKEIDFAAEFSVPFPSQVFLTLMGLPLEDLGTLLAMKDGLIRPEHAVGVAERNAPEATDHLHATASSVYAYFETVIEERRRHPEGDLVSTFLASEIDGTRLRTEEVLDICFLLLTAGLDTVTASLDCIFAYLANHPEQRQRLVDDPALIPSAVEELLRWETPVMGVVRVATANTELAGCPIQAGQQVSVLLGSANTDDDEFGDGDSVILDRQVNRHLAFGGGIHRCLGATLARLELKVALRGWHRRIPNYSIAPGAILPYTAGIRSIEHFPMVLGALA